MRVFALSGVLIAATFLCFRYLGEFSSKESVALTLVACVFYDVVYGLHRSLKAIQYAGRGFQPFYVWVLPNWPELLLDYKLISDIEEWHRLRAKNGLPAGFLFTVLKTGYSFGFEGPDLIYWNDRKVFVTKVDFGEEIEGIKFEDDISTRFGLEPRSPAIYFRHGELGIRVPRRLWEQICANDKQLAKVKTDTDYRFGTTEITVATLPVAEFDIYQTYWLPGKYDPTSEKKSAKKLNEKRDRALTENGWKRTSRRYDPAIGIKYPDELEHKYFTVEHKSI